MTPRTALPPVHAALVRAFMPGQTGQLRSIASKDCDMVAHRGERVTIIFDIPDGASRARAFHLAANKPDLADVGLPGATLTDLVAIVRDDQLTIDALVIFD